jgi:hypothetical protein
MTSWRRVCHGLMVAAAVGGWGCGVSGCGGPPNLRADHWVANPRPRLGRYPTATVGGAEFRGPEELGEHHYTSLWGERNGIVYTCRAGHIDIAHVRKAADAAAYVADQSMRAIEDEEREFSLRLSSPAEFVAILEYPGDWSERSAGDREHAAREVAITLGGYASYVESTWHEMITWFGYRNVVFYPEFPSAFSWEDSFSNLLGARLGMVALRDMGDEFDEAMTRALERELEFLGVQSKETAREASERVRGQWYSGEFLFLVDVRKRNLDTGFDDGYVTPWLVPGVRSCEGAEAQRYPIPRLEDVTALGFGVRLEIEPKAGEEKDVLERIGRHSGREVRRIDPEVHFPLIMELIREDAVERYGAEAVSGDSQASPVPSDGR